MSPNPLLHNQVLRQAAEVAATGPTPCHIRSLLGAGDAHAIAAALQQAGPSFPCKPDAQGRIALFPYRRVPEILKTLMAELGSSITIRPLEKLSRLEKLLIDPLFSQAMLVDAARLPACLQHAAQTPLSSGLQAVLALAIRLDSAQAGDAWIMSPDVAPPPLDPGHAALVCFYYHFIDLARHPDIAVR